jgi:sec-independent protein translocase protein TatA
LARLRPTAVSFRLLRRDMMPQLGLFEFFIILVIFMIFFGAGKIGDIGGALNKGIRLFKENAGIGDSAKKDDSKKLNP